MTCRLLVLVAAATALGTADTALAQQRAPALPATEIPERIDHSPGDRLDSALCGACHRDIYDSWSRSVHARSYREPVFQSGLAQAIADEGMDVARTCLTCHSPATIALERSAPNQLMEGVNCQSCHAMKAPNPGGFPPYELERELILYGPYDDASSPVHEVRYSEFTTTAEFCATCHEYTGPAGAEVLSTFTEYGAGSYPALTACQGCHMPQIPGYVVTAEVESKERAPYIDSHLIPGGRDIDQLRRAVGLQLLEVERGSGALSVRVALQNRAAGHWLPTGMPSRRMVLQVSTDWGEEIHSRSFVFGRRVIDADGNLLRRVPDMILHGARVVNDTRLRPNQTREFQFDLPAPTGVPTRLTVRVYYESTELPEQPPVTDDIVRIVREGL